MNVYGLQIGQIGLEFPSREDRDKAILTFTRGTCVDVSDASGKRYGEGAKAFGTYERDNAMALMNCGKCKGVFMSETCHEREVPTKDWNGKFQKEGMSEVCLCDGCYAQWMEDKRVHDAKETLAANQSA